MEIDVAQLLLPDFADIWFTNCHCRYRNLKGGRETGKSFNFIGMEPLFKLLADERRNVMMIRQNDKDNANSTFTSIKSCARRLKIDHLFKFSISPLKITRKKTGQVILFAGMNDVQNITSTSVETGYWTDIYFEEASQLKSYADFQVVDGSLRVPNDEPDLFCQITFCMNAWDVGHWTNDVFWKDNLEDDILVLENERYQFKEIPDFNIGFGFGLALHISSYRCNTHRSVDKDASMQILKEKMYDYYLVAGLGCWGNLTEKTYSHFTDALIKPEYMINAMDFSEVVIGIDFGMSNGEGKIKYSKDNADRLGSANTMQLIGVSMDYNTIVAIDEYFDSNEGRSETEKKRSPTIQKEMIDKIVVWQEMHRWSGRLINCYVDCADSGGFIDGLVLEARNRGLYNVRFIPSTKIPILTRIYFTNIMHAYGAMIYSERCKNLIRETRNARKAEDGKPRQDFDDHAINAWEYGWAAIRRRVKLWKTFKAPDSTSDIEVINRY